MFMFILTSWISFGIYINTTDVDLKSMVLNPHHIDVNINTNIMRIIDTVIF